MFLLLLNSLSYKVIIQFIIFLIYDQFIVKLDVKGVKSPVIEEPKPKVNPAIERLKKSSKFSLEKFDKNNENPAKPSLGVEPEIFINEDAIMKNAIDVSNANDAQPKFTAKRISMEAPGRLMEPTPTKLKFKDRSAILKAKSKLLPISLYKLISFHEKIQQDYF